METVACNLCGSTHHTALYQMPDRNSDQAEVFSVVECEQCGLGFVNPRPLFEDMWKCYPSERALRRCPEERGFALERGYFGRNVFVYPLAIDCIVMVEESQGGDSRLR